MAKQYRGAQNYDAGDFDRWMCLLPGVATWIVIVFLMRPYVVMAMSFANRTDRMGLIDLIYPERFWFALNALAALPAIAVVVAYLRRRPEAGKWPRRVWANGRIWLIASAVANLVVALVAIVLAPSQGAGIVLPLMVCGAAWTLWYLVVAHRVRDTFMDFPTADDEKAAEEAESRIKRR